MTSFGIAPRSSDNTSAQPTPSTTPVISSSSDTPAEENQHQQSDGGSNEWGSGGRLRQRRSTSRVIPASTAKPSVSNGRQTRSSDNAHIQSPPPPPLPAAIVSTTASSTLPPATDGVATKEESSTVAESGDLFRSLGAVSATFNLYYILLLCLIKGPLLLQTKRKSEPAADVSTEVATTQEKKTCRRGDGAESSSSIYCHAHRNPIPSKDNPPPGFCQWLHTFQVRLKFTK